MYVFLTILAIIVCILLILIVLVQEPKGGGLSSSFGASNQIMGVKKTGDFLEQATWGLAIGLLVICLSMKVFSPSSSKEESVVQQQAEKSNYTAPVAPSNNPNNKIPSPGAGQRALPPNSPAAVPSTQKPAEKAK